MRKLFVILVAAGALAVPASAQAKSCGWTGSLRITASFHTSCGLARKVGWYIHGHHYIKRWIWIRSPATGGYYLLHCVYDSANWGDQTPTWVYRGHGLHHSLIMVKAHRYG